ncbi:MAG: glycosyltransferase [Chitinophagales bacterium]|nr:glycosyltransferase [Chitinophagales bacterium]
MKLSVVIVNYNVRHFLEQCLVSVKRSCVNMDAEVFVVDNASQDGSVEMVREKFPEVKLIANTENLGFSKANNRAIEKASGEFVLLLNPDTVVAEDTFQKCIAFMEAHPDAGGLGVHMVDGKGNFLPESKRGLPTPSVAFYKTFGLAALFPKSKTFGKYHLGFLDKNKTHEVEILSGAFMMLRKSVLDKIGLLDETFFMYGEDVDLSYRIIKTGFKNYYFADTTIIHYKGESTKKGSLNYVKVFYNAMLIFARKHFSGNQSGLFSLLIRFAIVFRGALTLLSSFIASSYLFVLDALLSFAGIFLIKTYWENMIKYSEHYYPNQFLFIVVPAYIFIWIFSAFLSGAYDKPFRVSKILRGIVLGTVAIAVLYAFIPDAWRFSRAMILLGAAWTGFEMLFTRITYHFVKNQSLSVEENEEGICLIAGEEKEALRAEKILRQSGSTAEVVYCASLTDVGKMAAIYRATEIIFCSAGYSFKEIIAQLMQCGSKIDYKILNPGSDALIGSNSKDSAGDLYVAEKSYALFRPENLRRKRLTDVLLCMAFILISPLNLILIIRFRRFLPNWFSVLKGEKSWVGFGSSINTEKFPHAKQGVVFPSDDIRNFALTEQDITAAELNYARHYSVSKDLRLLFRNFKYIGR